MQWHRALIEEDVETAHLLIDQHQPVTGGQVCASATHLINAPLWPCERHAWAEQVLLAEERGEVSA